MKRLLGRPVPDRVEAEHENPRGSPRTRMVSTLAATTPLVVAALTFAYVVAGKFGLMFAQVHPSATAVWAPTGIALAGLLLCGTRAWPAVFAGAFLVNVTTAGSVATSLGIATGNTLEAVIGAALVKRFANGAHAFDRPRHVLAFALVGGVVGPVVSATVGATTLSLAGFSDWARYWSVWTTWWLGDAAGAVTVAPVLLLWSTRPRGRRRSTAHTAEAGLLLATLLVIGFGVFGGLLPIGARHYELDFLCMPPLVWAAFRFGPRETATGTALLAGIALWGTVHGFGPFVRDSHHESLLLLQIFTASTAVMALVFSAVVSQQERAEGLRRGLAAIVESSADAIIGKNLDGIVQSWNAGAERVFGYAPDEVVGRPITVLIPDDRADEEPRIIEHVRRGGRVEPFDTVRRRKDGREIQVSLSISPVHDEAGHVVGISKIARDVTEQKRIEAAARRAEALQSVMKLANAAAHEINNPLTVVIGHVDLLAQDDRVPPWALPHLKQALGAGQRIGEIVSLMKQVTDLTVAEQPRDLPEMLDLRGARPGGAGEAPPSTARC
jgi:PAS domain S-box-containing protein